MALTEEQLAFITWLERPDDRPENEYPRGTASVGEIMAVCQFEGLGLPSEEDVEAILQKLRGVTPAESARRIAAIHEASPASQLIPLPAGRKLKAPSPGRKYTYESARKSSPES